MDRRATNEVFASLLENNSRTFGMKLWVVSYHSLSAAVHLAWALKDEENLKVLQQLAAAQKRLILSENSGRENVLGVPSLYSALEGTILGMLKSIKKE